MPALGRFCCTGPLQQKTWCMNLMKEPLVAVLMCSPQSWSCVAWDAPAVSSPVPTLRLGEARARRVHPISGAIRCHSGCGGWASVSTALKEQLAIGGRLHQVGNHWNGAGHPGDFAVIVLVILRPPVVWWAILALTISFVLTAELMNSAFEALVDLLHPEQHPEIRVIKDLAAGGVLLASIGGRVPSGGVTRRSKPRASALS
jgi:hypothetical protein